jgi:hypothetical protein
MFGPKRKKEIGGCGEFYNLYPSPDIKLRIRVSVFKEDQNDSMEDMRS